MKKVILSMAVAMFVLGIQQVSAQIFKSVEGNNDYVRVTKKVEDFHKVKLSNSFNVVYVQNPDSAGIVNIKIESSILEKLSVKSEKGELSLKLKGLGKKDFGIILVEIYSSSLSRVENDGGGVFESHESVKAPELYLGISGSGQIKMDLIDCNILKAKVAAGDGDMLLKGVADHADYSILGGGEIRAHGVKSDDANCVITGNGNIGCNVSKKLTATITGAGNVYYEGNPEISKKGIGKGKVLPINAENVEE